MSDIQPRTFRILIILGYKEMITELSAIMNHSVYTPPGPTFLSLTQGLTLQTKFILMLPKNLFKFVT